MPSLDRIESLLLILPQKNKAVKTTLASIEDYKKGKISKDYLIKQLKSCLVVVAENGLFGNTSIYDIEDPYRLFENLIYGFSTERAGLKIDPKQVLIIDLTPRNFKKYSKNILDAESVFVEGWRMDLKELKRIMSCRKPICKIAIINSQFVGEILGHCPDLIDIRENELEIKSPDPKLMYIDTFVVLPKFQWRGVGIMLFWSFVQESRAQGYKILEGHFKNDSSYYIIKKYNAKDIELKKGWGGKGQDCMYCRLYL